MQTHDEMPGQASGKTESVEQAEAAMPSLTESLLALGLLLITAITTWLLYGQMIQFMPMYIRHVLGR